MIAAASTRSIEIITATTLTGSERQIEWAARIRANWRDHTFGRGMLERTDFSKSSDGIHPEEIEQATTNVLAARIASAMIILSRTRAADWIDASKNQLLDRSIELAIEEAKLIERDRLNKARR